MTITHIIGIDPGLSGAIALINADTGELFDVTDMPTRKTVKANGKGGTVIDMPALDATMIDYIDHGYGPANVAIVIEAQSTRPGLAAGSVFKTGEGYGILKGYAQASGCQWTTIRPQDWKATHNLIGAGSHLPAGSKRTRAIKTASREAAMARFPHHADLFRLAKNDGRAEAALIGDAYVDGWHARPVAA
jgi:crossover junction endodeoxyribonuclease RuvC